MEPNEYKVKILHFINPHLIWALVENEEDKIHFEQIGIYGILPVSVELDYEGNIATKRAEEWIPAIFVAMKKILLEAKEVWFTVSFVDQTTSLFDDNLHKFGDLKIKLNNGNTVSMLQRLLDTGLVAEDVHYFQTSLKTKLEYIQMVMVINKMKQAFPSINIPRRDLEKALQKQTSIFEKTVELEENASARNLDIVDRDHHMKLLEKSISDLNACKDIDEVSAGRASTVKSFRSSLSSGLMKKLSLVDFEVERKEERVGNVPIKEECVDINQNENKYDCKNKQETGPWINPNKGSEKKNQQKDLNKDKKYVALGPSGLNRNLYGRIEIIKTENEPKPSKPIEKEEQPIVQKDIFERTDSEVNLNVRELKFRAKPIPNEENSNNSCTNDELKSVSQETQSPVTEKKGSRLLYRKLKVYKETLAKMNESSSTGTDSATRQGDDSDSESITAIVEKLDLKSNNIKKASPPEPDDFAKPVKNNVNPFKNLDGSKSVFVEKLVKPSVMVHTKNGNCIQPVSSLRDVPFGTDIQVVLRNMSIKKPMRPQSVSWPIILRGHSLFLVSPSDSGKTMGYLPAVCRLVKDYKMVGTDLSISRLTCIIVCATSNSVAIVEDLCKMILYDGIVFACYAGMADLDITTTLLNGCDILICTPCLLVRLLRENLGVDLRNLHTFVIDDCERISELYENEIKFCNYKIKEMLKARANKELKVQYIAASRIWCNFMSNLAKKSPDSVVCIGGFQECVLYSEVDTSVEFLKEEDKLDAVFKFLSTIHTCKKTVIVCRSNEEVHLIEKALIDKLYVVFACDNTMTVQDLYNIDLALSEYNEPMSGPILVCCDGNLAHLNITDADYLIHYSLPELFSLFCKRFAVLIDKYQSIFDKQDSTVKIKVFLDNSNIEQLPKILNFIKRCTSQVPAVLDEISSTVTLEKDLKKAHSYVPICNTLLTSGKCSDIWNCKQRHAIFQEFDEPKDWVPKEGIISFKILHFHTAVQYSARMISCANEKGVKKYPQTYSMLSIKLGMYYSKESNRKLHGVAKPGDFCAVSLKHNLFVRCQVIKVLQYTQNNHPYVLLINLIDEEKYERARDTCLYYLPDELKKIDTHVVKVNLTGLLPLDKDTTYSKLIEDKLKEITEKNDDLYMRGKVVMAVGNHVFVETLEACQDLYSLNETVVKHNFKEELLDGFAINNPDHINILENLGKNVSFMTKKEAQFKELAVPKPIKILPEPRWAYLEVDSHIPIYYLYAKNPDLLFVQHVKFQDCLNFLLKDIKKHVSENPEPVEDAKIGDIVLAEFPDDAAYERARIDEVLENNKVKCFYVDLGDWRIVSIDKLRAISGKIITQLPFQAIECRLVGVKPVGDKWSDFTTNWLVDQFYDSKSDLKYVYAKRCTTEKAKCTAGDKYGVVLIDTNDGDVCINSLLINANLAEENEEFEMLKTNDIPSNIVKERKTINDDSSDDDDSIVVKKPPNKNAIENISPKKTPSVSTVVPYYKEREGVVVEEIDITKVTDNWETEETSEETNKENNDNNKSLTLFKENNSTASSGKQNSLIKNPIRSIPLVNDDEFFDPDRWDCGNPMDWKCMLNNNEKFNAANKNKTYSEKNQNVESNATAKVVEIRNTLTKEKDTSRTVGEKKSPLRETLTGNSTKIENNHKIVDQKASASDNKNEIAATQKTVSEQKAGSKTVADNKTETHNGNCTKIEKDKTTLLEPKTRHPNSYWSLSLINDNTILLTDQSNKDMKLELTWSQDTKYVYIKIKIITDNYELIINDKELKFYTTANDVEYGFELELYGVVDVDESSHTNKGKYVEVILRKVMGKKWLNLNSGDVKQIVRNDKKIDTHNKTSKPTKPTTVPIDALNTTKIDELNIFTTNKNTAVDKLKKPKIVWRQNKTKVTVKVLLITEKYNVTIEDKFVKFLAYANDEVYGFDLDLYGVVHPNKSTHANKGQYIQINLMKVLQKNWLILSVGNLKKWIMYDVDSIDVSSSDEEKTNDDDLEILKKNLNFDHDSDSDDEFEDDINFKYKKQL